MFAILQVVDIRCQLVVRVQHFNPDGSDWFREAYTWQGREGLKCKRMTNPDGLILMDDGEPAPTRVVAGQVEQYLPADRTWARYSAPHMDDSSILDIIRTVHGQGRAQGYDGWNDDIQFNPNTQDEDGCSVLVAKFDSLIGHYDR